MSSELSIDFYLNSKNTLQNYLNQMNKEQLIELFNIILEYNPDIPYSKNKNGYFIDIKLLPKEVIDKIEQRCNEINNL